MNQVLSFLFLCPKEGITLQTASNTYFRMYFKIPEL